MMHVDLRAFTGQPAGSPGVVKMDMGNEYVFDIRQFDPQGSKLRLQVV
jgi:hypothetical protein